MRGFLRGCLLWSGGLALSIWLVGCVGGERLTQEQKDEITAIRERILELSQENAALYAKHKAGALSPEDFAAALEANTKALSEVNARAQKLEQSGVSAGEAFTYGALGGLGGRSSLHGIVHYGPRLVPLAVSLATRTLPLAAGPVGWVLNGIIGLAGFLLQSESKKKPAPVPV